MKLSELWLREWIDIAGIDSESLYDYITMTGIEINSVESVAGTFSGVIVGEIIKCNRHPNDSTLHITKINVGNERLLNIICSASNCRQGIKVAVATVGAVLPKNLKIKIKKLMGVLSEGMLCSFSELNISDDYSGIIELPADAPIGMDIRKYLKLDDKTIRISVSNNRADCLSIIGVARDVAVLSQAKLNTPIISPVVATINDILSVQVDVAEACPRYLGRLVKNINIKALTPLWMKEKLRRCGINSINAVVDITNYILLELGQPIYFIDSDYIEGGIVVRMAKEGEFVILDNNKIKLRTNTIIIADHNKVLTIGGIFSGSHHSVSRKTKNVLLESIFFNPSAIAGYARHYKLNTDASHYYERGVDTSLQYKSMEYATHLLINICGGEAGPLVDIVDKTNLPKRTTITLRRNKLDRIIGYHIKDALVNNILHRLGFVVNKSQDDWQVVAPSWRFDINIEEDLVEEIARVYGYNNIPNTRLQADLKIIEHRESTVSLKRVKNMLNDKGYQEVITYSFVNPKLQQLIHPDEKTLILLNPISNEMSVMRLSLWTGLLSTIIYNRNRQQSRVRIFETGLRFVPDIRIGGIGVRQDLMLAGAVNGNRYEDHWDMVKGNVDFYDIKGDIESILDLTGKLSEIKFHAKLVPALHPGQSAGIYLQGEHIGFIGTLHPETERKLGLSSRTVLFELEWSKISECIIPRAQEISQFPANRRDIAIIVAEEIPASDILAECKKVGADYIVDANLFDVYFGKNIIQGYKSLAISLIIQNIDRTLEEKEITDTVAKCVEALKNKFQASLRD